MKLYRVGFKRIYAYNKLRAENALDFMANENQIEEYKYFSEYFSAMVEYSLMKRELNNSIISHEKVWLYEGITLESTEIVLDGEPLEDVFDIFRNIKKMPYCILKKFVKE